MYHDVEDVASNIYSVSTGMFEDQLKYLKDNFEIVSLRQAYEFLTGQKELKNTVIAVSMDDGRECIYYNAFPLLKKNNVPGCVFLTTADKGIVTKDQVKEMRAAGIEFGGHTRTHCLLSRAPLEQMKEEIVGCKADLEAVLSESIEFFAYPYGLRRHYNQLSRQIVQEAGYKCAFSAINGINYPGCELFDLKRTKIERDDSLESFKKIVNGALDCWSIFDSI
ncbi:MAG TPA: polysaccharide deacetylase family protein [Candidatus Omnitrophota bacterium]|nr:polysaccharide deacetylase family protein [Candidatus Omnitrophota bacterium]